MHARIALRKFKILPAKDEEAENKLVKTEMLAIKNSKGRKLTEDEVISAFSNGEEVFFNPLFCHFFCIE